MKAEPKLEDVSAVLSFHTDAPFTATLKTGSAMLNKLWSNILWGQRSNFVGVPTDCPQRDERLGWSADAQVFWRTATYNMDLTTFSRKFGRICAARKSARTCTDLRAGDQDSEPWLWNGMERCRRRGSMDVVDSDRRQAGDRRELGTGWKSILPRSRRRIPTIFGKRTTAFRSRIGSRLRAVTPVDSDRDSVLGLRRDTDEPDGSRRGKSGRRAKVQRAF